ncbi:MAG: PilZ domain-containing protein [Vicinamibacterales bacterium]
MSDEAERRREPRLAGVDLPDGLTGRIRPGHQVRVVDISRSGILIDSARRLLPGTQVDVQLEAGPQRHACRARVVRCGVATLQPQLVIYRAGLELEQGVGWLDEASG